MRVAVVDSETVSRSALPMLLPADFTVSTYNGVQILLAEMPEVDVVVADPAQCSQRAGLSATDAVNALLFVGYRTCVYSSDLPTALLARYLAAGVAGAVHKRQPLDDLVDAIRRIASGAPVLTVAVPGLAELVGSAAVSPPLSARQRQVLAGRSRGEKFDSIAGRLFITKKVAEEHWQAVRRKYANFLTTHSAADLERILGFAPAEILETVAA